jgi:hypothetical protein
MTAAVFDLARSSQRPSSCSSATRRPFCGQWAGRVVIGPEGDIGLVAGAAEGVIGYFAQSFDYTLPSFPLGAKAHRGIIHIEGEAP